MSTNVALVMTLLQMVGSLVMMIMCVMYANELRYQGLYDAANIVYIVTNVAHMVAQLPGLALLIYYY